MPILHADESRNVIVCNLDTKPGYSGVDNTLYSKPNFILLLGTASETIALIIEGFKDLNYIPKAAGVRLASISLPSDANLSPPFIQVIDNAQLNFCGIKITCIFIAEKASRPSPSIFW